MTALIDALPAGVVDSTRVEAVTGTRVDTKLVPELVEFQPVGGPPPELVHARADRAGIDACADVTGSHESRSY